MTLHSASTLAGLLTSPEVKEGLTVELDSLRAENARLKAELAVLTGRVLREERLKEHLHREVDGLAAFTNRWALFTGRAPARESRVIITTVNPSPEGKA